MKAIKYVFLGALMLSVSAPAAAQEEKAAIDQAAQIIKSNAPDAAKQVQAIYKKNKKNGEVIVGIGRAFFEARDTANARVYAEYGTKLKYSPAYVLLGDLAALADDGGAAAKYYDQAIYFDETNAEAYRKYAIIYSRISFQSSIDKLEQLRSKVPGYPVDLPIARLYDNAGKIDEAIRHYEKVDRSQMEAGDLGKFALKYYLNKDYDKSMSVVADGLKKFPRSSSLNRVGLMNTIAQEKFDDALNYADRLFNKSDSADLKDFDYNNYAKAYIGKGNFDEAIGLYRKAMEVSQADKDAVNNLYKEISDAYMKKGDFDAAVAEYRKYLDGTSSKTASDYSTLAEMYYKHAADLQGDEQMASIKQADDIYKELQERFANNQDVVAYVLNRRGTLNVIMDPDSKQGLAKPVFEQLMQMMEAKADRSDSDNKKLITCYRYMLSYDLLVQDNKAAAKEWAQKILTLDPENEQAKAVMEL
ncbi:MAG: tetratricopeptide repeat protein [Prevotella sp.]|nr:tetratricopeptide repeat protein [Prevotella sp.]